MQSDMMMTADLTYALHFQHVYECVCVCPPSVTCHSLTGYGILFCLISSLLTYIGYTVNERGNEAECSQHDFGNLSIAVGNRHISRDLFKVMLQPFRVSKLSLWELESIQQ